MSIFGGWYDKRAYVFPHSRAYMNHHDDVEKRLIGHRDALAAAAITAAEVAADASAAVDVADATLDDYYYALAAVEKAAYDLKSAKEAEAIATQKFGVHAAIFHNAEASIMALKSSAHVAVSLGVLVNHPIMVFNPFKRAYDDATDTMLRCIKDIDAAHATLDAAAAAIGNFDAAAIGDADCKMMTMMMQNGAKKPRHF